MTFPPDWFTVVRLHGRGFRFPAHLTHEDLRAMISEKDTLEGAIADFTMLRNCSPYRFSGKWYIAQTAASRWEAYRTKKAAEKHTISQVWSIAWGK